MLQAQQIVTLACQIAKGPGFTQQAGQLLNNILEDLYLNRDLKMNRVTQTIILPANTYGPIALESDYLRTYDLFYPFPTATGSNTGLTQFLHPITMEQWDAEFKDPSTANYPYEFATDVSSQAQVWSGGSVGVGTKTSAGFIKVYPQSSGQITLTHRYMVLQPLLTTPETSTNNPWFPFTKYLIEELSSQVMGLTGDDRRDAFHKNAEELLRPYLIMEGDEQGTVRSIRLDPKHFRQTRLLRPTKATGPF